MSTAVAAAAPGSPVANTRRSESPPSAPGPRKWSRRTRGGGQVLLDAVEVRLVSGNVLAELRGNGPLPSDEFWYTCELRNQIAILLGVEVCRLTLADAKGNSVSDDDCVIEGPLTAIVGPPLEEPRVFEGLATLRD